MARRAPSPEPRTAEVFGPEPNVVDPEAEAITFATEPSEAAAIIPTPAAPRKKPKIFFYGAVFWIALVVFAAIFASVLPLQDPLHQDIINNLAPPGTAGHLLGTDALGRDILARLAFGARVSLIVSLTAVFIGTVVGGTIGLTTGFFRGWYERLAMSIIDVLLAFPALVLLLALVAYVGQSLRTIALVIGFLSIPAYTRVSRASTLSISQREYVLAARAMGATSRRILFRELLPNVMLPVLAFALVAIGVVIVAEGSLAFLGLSVKFPTPTWGAMIAEGKIHVRDAPHIALIPSLCMFLTVLSLNYVGDQLRSRFDVRESAL